MAYTIRVKNPLEAFIKCYQSVVKNGHMITDNDQRLKEILAVSLDIEDPSYAQNLPEDQNLSEMIRWMYGNFLKTVPVKDWGYSYGSRITNYAGVDQLKRVIKKLQKNPECKSASITLGYPPEDEGHTPCVMCLDFKIRGGKLNGFAFFRSQDVGKKMIADILSISELIKKISESLSVPAGSLRIFISSLHYYDEDKDRIAEFVAKVDKASTNQ